MKDLLFVLAALALVACTSAQSNFTNDTDEMPASGSGRMQTCDDITCTGSGHCRISNTTNMPYCWCYPGNRLVNNYHCEGELKYYLKQ